MVMIKVATKLAGYLPSNQKCYYSKLVQIEQVLLKLELAAT